jgi:hypothetical protein
MNAINKKDFEKLICELSDGNGIRLDKDDGEGLIITLVNSEYLSNLSENMELFHIIGLWERPWVQFFFNFLEYEHFEPGTEKNKEFQFLLFKWEGLMWGIVSIPIEKRQLAEISANSSRLKLADGVPVVINGGSFPLNCDMAFTLENLSNDIIYEPGGVYDAKISENFELRKLWKKHGVG